MIINLEVMYNNYKRHDCTDTCFLLLKTVFHFIQKFPFDPKPNRITFFKNEKNLSTQFDEIFLNEKPK